MNCKDCRLLNKDTQTCALTKRKIHDINTYPGWCMLVINSTNLYRVK